jgi:hypothetical protein
VARVRKMLTYAHHVGLYSEEITLSGVQVGNFPLAFSHLALVDAAITLDEALDRVPPDDGRACMRSGLAASSPRSPRAAGDGDSIHLEERRALRGIEEHLAAEDPALAGLRATGPARPGRLVRRVRRWVLTAAVTLVALGMILDLGGLVVVGFLMLSTLPVLLAMLWHPYR